LSKIGWHWCRNDFSGNNNAGSNFFGTAFYNGIMFGSPAAAIVGTWTLINCAAPAVFAMVTHLLHCHLAAQLWLCSL